jgi:hypothetical protein
MWFAFLFELHVTLFQINFSFFIFFLLSSFCRAFAAQDTKYKETFNAVVETAD